MREDDASTGPIELGSERVEAFSDAVMAVIITIMAFELRAPDGATWAKVVDEIPSMGATREGLEVETRVVSVFHFRHGRQLERWFYPEDRATWDRMFRV